MLRTRKKVLYIKGNIATRVQLAGKKETLFDVFATETYRIKKVCEIVLFHFYTVRDGKLNFSTLILSFK
jgi:hypothetical protein